MLQSTATKLKIILSQELQKMERKSLKAERRSENQETRFLSLFLFLYARSLQRTLDFMYSKGLSYVIK